MKAERATASSTVRNRSQLSEGSFRLAGYYQTDKSYAEGENPGMLRSILGVGGRAPYGDEPAIKDCL